MDKPSAAQQRRQRLEELERLRSERQLDEWGLILRAEDLYISCIDSGIVSEKVHTKLDNPFEVIERNPQVALACLKFIHDLGQDVQKELDRLPPADPIINIIMSRKRLEDVLEDAEEI